jgi:hypothetical protein
LQLPEASSAAVTACIAATGPRTSSGGAELFGAATVEKDGFRRPMIERFAFFSQRGLMILARALGFGLVLLTLPVLAGADAPRSPKEALQVFNDLIGSWRGTATPAGTKEEQQKGFWIETLTWEWQFKGKDAWLKIVFDKSKNFTGGELRYLPEQDAYALTLRTPSKETLTFTGPFKDKVLTLAREGKDDTQRLVFTLLHENRFLYRYEVRPAGKTLFSRRYGVGATKEGVAFAAGDGKPECIVSGGLGTLPVLYMGKTYYVCCSGCRDEFRENPEKYVKEFEAKKKGKK